MTIQRLAGCWSHAQYILLPTSILLSLSVVNIHITVISLPSPLLQKLLPSWGLLVYLWLSAILHWGAEESLLAPLVLCNRAIRWGPTIIAHVSKWLLFWTLEPGEKVWEDNWIPWLVLNLNKWTPWLWLRGGPGSAAQWTPEPSRFGTLCDNLSHRMKWRCSPLEYWAQHWWGSIFRNINQFISRK